MEPKLYPYHVQTTPIFGLGAHTHYAHSLCCWTSGVWVQAEARARAEKDNC